MHIIPNTGIRIVASTEGVYTYLLFSGLKQTFPQIFGGRTENEKKIEG